MWAPRASASTSSGSAYSRSIRSRTRRRRARASAARWGGGDEGARRAGGGEPVEQAEQLLDVGEVEAGGRLVEDVDAALLGHVGGQREPLTFAPGPRRER